MSKQKVKNKIYALIIAVTLFVSVNNLSQAEEKSGIIGKELADSSTTTSTTGTEEQNDEISDVKIRYSQDEIDMANQLSEKVKKKRKKEKRKEARRNRKNNNIFEAQEQAREDLTIGAIQFTKLNEITPVAEELDAYYKSKGYTTDNYAKEQQLGPKYVQLYEQFVPIYADFDNVMHKINTDRLQQRLQQLRDAGKKNAAAAQEVHLRLTAVLEKIDSEKQLDVNAINQELQSIGDVSNGITSPKYDSVKTSVNSTIGAIRTYMGSKQDNDYNRMIEAYNHYISNLNTTNMNELD